MFSTKRDRLSVTVIFFAVTGNSLPSAPLRVRFKRGAHTGATVYSPTFGGSAKWTQSFTFLSAFRRHKGQTSNDAPYQAKPMQLWLERQSTTGGPALTVATADVDISMYAFRAGAKDRDVIIPFTVVGDVWRLRMRVTDLSETGCGDTTDGDTDATTSLASSTATSVTSSSASEYPPTKIPPAPPSHGRQTITVAFRLTNLVQSKLGHSSSYAIKWARGRRSKNRGQTQFQTVLGHGALARIEWVDLCTLKVTLGRKPKPFVCALIGDATPRVELGTANFDIAECCSPQGRDFTLPLYLSDSPKSVTLVARVATMGMTTCDVQTWHASQSRLTVTTDSDAPTASTWLDAVTPSSDLADTPSSFSISPVPERRPDPFPPPSTPAAALLDGPRFPDDQDHEPEPEVVSYVPVWPEPQVFSAVERVPNPWTIGADHNIDSAAGRQPTHIRARTPSPEPTTGISAPLRAIPESSDAPAPVRSARITPNTRVTRDGGVIESETDDDGPIPLHWRRGISRPQAQTRRFSNRTEGDIESHWHDTSAQYRRMEDFYKRPSAEKMASLKEAAFSAQADALVGTPYGRTNSGSRQVRFDAKPRYIGSAGHENSVHGY